MRVGDRVRTIDNLDGTILDGPRGSEWDVRTPVGTRPYLQWQLTPLEEPKLVQRWWCQVDDEPCWEAGCGAWEGDDWRRCEDRYDTQAYAERMGRYEEADCKKGRFLYPDPETYGTATPGLTNATVKLEPKPQLMICDHAGECDHVLVDGKICGHWERHEHRAGCEHICDHNGNSGICIPYEEPKDWLVVNLLNYFSNPTNQYYRWMTQPEALAYAREMNQHSTALFTAFRKQDGVR